MFTNSKWERLNHVLKAIHVSQRKYLSPSFRTQSARKCLQFAIFNFSEKLQNIL